MTAVYVFGVIMGVLILAVVFAPLVEDRLRGKSGDSPEERKEQAIEALRELEFEYQTGKVSDEDYAKLRARYAKAAVAARDDLGERIDPGACSSCGAARKEGASFCSTCGARLD